jgi:hypothetical protein
MCGGDESGGVFRDAADGRRVRDPDRPSGGRDGRGQREQARGAVAVAVALLGEDSDDPADFGLVRGRAAPVLAGRAAGRRGGVAASSSPTARDEGPYMRWRLDAAGFRPGEFFFEGKAAAVAPPALIGGGTPAGVVPAGERLARANCLGLGRRKQREAGRADHLAEERQPHDRAVLPPDLSYPVGFPHRRLHSEANRIAVQVLIVLARPDRFHGAPACSWRTTGALGEAVWSRPGSPKMSSGSHQADGLPVGPLWRLREEQR